MLKPAKRIALPLAVAAMAAAPGAHAKEIKLIVAAPAPAMVTYVTVFKDKFIPNVNKKIAATGEDFKIKWVGAYGSSIAKPYEHLEAVEANIAQVGLMVKNFEESKLPLEQYATMGAFSGETDEQIIEIDANIRKQVAAMNEGYLKNGQTFLRSGVSPMYDLFTKFPVKSVDDLKGRKIGVSGVLGQFFRGTGATTVTSAMVESYTSLRSGVYEGYPISIGLAFPFKTYEGAKYYTPVHFGVSTGTAITVNTQVWKKLPGFVQKIFQEEADKWPHWQVASDRAKLKKFTAIMKKKGVKFGSISEKERQRWANTLPNIAREWADRQEQKGLPGRAVLTAYMNELRRVNAPMLRQWDKE